MEFIGSVEHLTDIIEDGVQVDIALGGDLVFVTNEKDAIARLGSDDDAYVMQQRRMASRGRVFDKEKVFLYIGLDSEAATLLDGYKGRIVFQADQYLAYGLSLKSNSIVVGGSYPSGVNNDASVLVMVFTDNALQSVYERKSPITGYHCELLMADIVTRYPDHQIHWCAPLELPPMSDLTTNPLFVDAGQSATTVRVNRKVSLKKGAEKEGLYLVPGIVTALVGFFAYVGIVGFYWAGIESERNQYARLIAGYEEAYANSRHSLDLLRHREYYLRQTAESSVAVARLEVLLAGSAQIDRVMINSIGVSARNSDNESEIMSGEADEFNGGDFLIDVSIPADSSQGGARFAGEPLAKRLSALTGYSVQLMGHTEEMVTDRGQQIKYWRYRFGGGF